MKNSILVIALIFVISIVTFSCKDKEKQVPETEMKDALADKYQCPMDCEEGKTYEEASKCPVCKMDLQKVKEE